MLNRRAFLAALGLTAASVTLNGLPWPAPADLSQATFTSGFPKVGDVFTIAGRYALNPITRKPTRHLQLWTITAVVGSSTATFKPHV